MSGGYTVPTTPYMTKPAVGLNRSTLDSLRKRLESYAYEKIIFGKKAEMGERSAPKVEEVDALVTV